jgi:diguanylate cyclase (GGDEF)-like protein/PAS domain S-box-containing protein
MTKNNDIIEAQKTQPINNVKNKNLNSKEQTEQTVFEMMCKSMPGAIISGYAEDGYPLYFVNDQYLKLLGYSSFEEYYESANGFGLTHIHPDDVDMVNKETMYSYSTDTQYGIEYRIRHKNGHYIHVYDVGKKMITPDKKEIIICVLYDMTEDAHLKELLIRESKYDFLTGIYNRGAGIQTIENELKYAKQYSFAFFDIDNLKKLNDKYNHGVGDIALKYFADLLMKEFGEQAVLARFGGDEFIAFFTERVEQSQIESILSKIEQGYCDFIEQNYPESHSSVSIGCVIGKKKCNFEELCQISDGLMYDIKKHGKNGYKIIEIG